MGAMYAMTIPIMYFGVISTIESRKGHRRRVGVANTSGGLKQQVRLNRWLIQGPCGCRKYLSNGAKSYGLAIQTAPFSQSSTSRSTYHS